MVLDCATKVPTYETHYKKWTKPIHTQNRGWNIIIDCKNHVKQDKIW